MQEVTVYSYGGDTKTFTDLGDKALTASGDELANTAEFYKTQYYSETPNFIKKRKSEPQPSLQPLPSSAFQNHSSSLINRRKAFNRKPAITIESR
jgi:hypothetical protein